MQSDGLSTIFARGSTMDQNQNASSSGAAPKVGLSSGRIALIYAVVAGLWVLLSDAAVAWFVREPGTMTRIASVKGSLFVVVTAAMLYVLVRRYVESLLAVDRALRRTNERLWLLNSIGSLVVCAESEAALLAPFCEAITTTSWVLGTAYFEALEGRCHLAASAGVWREADSAMAARVQETRVLEMTPPGGGVDIGMVAAVPVVGRSDTFGTLLITFKPGTAMDSDIERALTRVAETLAIGIADLRAREQATWEAAREAAIGRVAACLAESRPVASLAACAVEAAAQLSRGRRAVVCVRETGASGVNVWVAGSDGGKARAGDGGGQVLAALAADVRAEPRELGADAMSGVLANMVGSGDRVAAAPGIVGETVVGAVILMGAWPQPNELDVLVRLAWLLAESVRLQQSRDDLRAATDHLDAIVASSPIAVTSTDVDGRIVTWNPAAERVFGWSRDEVIGQRYPVITDDCAADLRRIHQLALAGSTLHGQEMGWIQRDGSRVELSVSVTSVHGPNGRFNGVLLLADDITEAKAAREALRRTMRLVSDLFGSVPMGLVICQLVEPGRLVLIDANPAAEMISGLRVAEWRGRPMEEVGFDLGVQDITDGILTAALEHEVVVVEDVPFVRDGAERLLRYRAFPMEGDRVGLAFEDVTETARTRQNLQDATVRLKAVYDGASVGIAMVRDQVFISANPQLLRLFGIPDDADLSGISPTSLVAEDRRADMGRYAEQLWSAATKSVPVDTVGRRMDGSEFPMLLDVSVVPLPDGDALVVFVTDITTLRQAQADLRMMQDRLLQTLDRIPLFAVSFDLDANVTYINDYALQILGYDRHEVLGCNWFSVLVEDEEAVTARQDVRRQQADGPNTRHYERQVKTRSGEIRNIWFSTTLLRDSQGDLVGISGIGEDITERRKAERALRQSEERLRKVLQEMPVMLLAFDERGTLVEWNREAERVTGYTAEQVVGNPHALEVLYPDAEYRAALLCEWLQASGDRRDWVWRVACKDGAERLIAWSSIAARAPIPGWASWGVGTDVTERIHAEEEVKRLNQELEQRVEFRTQELRAAYKEMEAFSYSVSHDLRAPLRAIDGFGQALVEDCAKALDECGKGHVDRIRAATKRMGQLIDDLLTLSRVSRAEIHREEVDLSVVCEQILESLRQSEPGRSVDVFVEPGISVIGDRRLLTVAMENLLGNAWKFTSRTPDAHIDVRMVTAKGMRCVCVHDNGAGFDMQYADKLFGAFQRLHTAEEFPGTGVGLATVQRVVAKHGGMVWAEAEVGKGASFFFRLGEEPDTR